MPVYEGLECGINWFAKRESDMAKKKGDAAIYKYFLNDVEVFSVLAQDLKTADKAAVTKGIDVEDPMTGLSIEFPKEEA